MSGNVDTRTELIPASGVVQLGNANFLFVIASTGTTAFKLMRSGLAKGANQENYTGVTAGLQLIRTQRWDFCQIIGAPGVSVTFMYGYVDTREDQTLFNQQIAVISGVTAVAISPASIPSDIAPVVTGAAQAALFAPNLARRRITVFSDPANPATVFLRKSGGANNIAYIQPGTYEEFDGTYGLDYAAGAAGNTLYLFEET